MATKTDDLEIRYMPAREVRFEQDGDAPPRLTGYAAVFDSTSEDMGFREVIRRGAFAATLAKNPDVRLLVNHDGLPLARTTSGTLKLYEDERGLRFETPLDPSDPDVQRIIPKVKRGDLTQMSFGFRTIKDSWRMEDGQEVRELHEVDIHNGDVSLVTYPAYVATDIAIRSRDAWKAMQEKREHEPQSDGPTTTPGPVTKQLSDEEIERELRLARVLSLTPRSFAPILLAEEQLPAR